MALFANIIIDSPLKTNFFYSIPNDLKENLQLGHFVKVPFRNKKKIGCVVGFSSKVDFDESKIRQIEEIINLEIIVPEELLLLSKWISNYYFCSWGEALFASTPAVLRNRVIKLVKSVSTNNNCTDYKVTLKQQEIISFLKVQKEPIPIHQLIGENTFSSSIINTLIKKNILNLEHIKENNNEIERSSHSYLSQNIIKPQLTDEQSNAVNIISKSLIKFQFHSYLLLGITGSGKTEVYLEIIQKAIELGKQAIMLVPEIALTPQTVATFKNRFNNVAIMHSNLTDKQRFLEWRKICAGNVDVVIGARSAIFAPLNNIGVIIVDEEHETSYKQDRAPRYNARDISILRAKNNDATVILGSATPSLESYLNSLNKKNTIINLKKRVGISRLPTFHIINLKDEVTSNKKFEIFSDYLLQEIKANIKRLQQSIIFLNRKGYFPHLSCKKCGETIKCKSCDIGLTIYKSQNKASCNYCGYSIYIPKNCPTCKSENIIFKGFGTERVEQVLRLLLPNARILRMDGKTMTTSKKHEKAYNDFKKHKYDILIGTQMIAKGLDFPKVTLVGILQIDSSLAFLDFRMAEKAYQLLCQVAGRAGRSKDLGKVVIQTYNPEHYVIEHAIMNNYKTFAIKELENRKKLSYPPYCKLAKILFRSRNERILISYTNHLSSSFKKVALDMKQICLGPAPAGIEKLENDYRIQFLFKCNSNGQRKKLLELVEKSISTSKHIRYFIDIDPQSTI
ncbi:MAG: primosomal protein N' [Planctomycetota bacterium]|nr:MAG: primosomal protein N' [Planctomycetota bacterium]